MDEQLEFVRLIASRLDSAGIPYMVTGSLAMAIYTIPRMTRDIDLVIECRLEDAVTIARLFETDCYVDLQSIREAVSTRSMFNVIHNEWVIKADFIVRKAGPFRQLEFERRKRVDIEGISLFVVAPEDLILSKLLWAKSSQSELQQRDVGQLVQSLQDLDWAYLERWAEGLDIAELLRRARSP